MPIDRIFAELHNPATWPPAPRPSMQPAYWRGLGRTPEQTRRRCGRRAELTAAHARDRRPMRCTKSTLGGSGSTLNPWSQALQKMFRLIPARSLKSKTRASQSGHCPSFSAITMRI